MTDEAVGRTELADWLSNYATCFVDDERCARRLLEIVERLRSGVPADNQEELARLRTENTALKHDIERHIQIATDLVNEPQTGIIEKIERELTNSLPHDRVEFVRHHVEAAIRLCRSALSRQQQSSQETTP